MSKELEVRVCKNKKCQKILPSGYKYEFCEACRNKRAETTKKVAKGTAAAVATAGSIALLVITGGTLRVKR